MEASISDPVPAIAAPDLASGDLGRPANLRRPGAISRDRLVSRLLRSADAPVVTLVAPAGYGKTTLLVEWADAESRDVAWVTLDERHDDPALLIGSIVAALRRIDSVDESLLEPLASPQPDVSRVIVPRLCASLGERSPFSIVLDDVHAVRARPALEVIAGLAEQLPHGSQIVVASREEPAIGLGRLRARRDVVELGPDDMAMTRSEASRLFRASGQSLDREIVAGLVDRTEGWPAALYLAARWLEREDDPARALELFTGDGRLVADYLREEFLSRIDSGTLDFLIRVSVLDRLSGDVCDAVLEREGSAGELRGLSRSNLLLIPLDHRDHEYRFHALLREMLSAELHRLGEGGERALHARASRWYADHGDADRSVDHAIASGDVAAAGELIWASTPVYSSSGRHSTLVRWLGEFTPDQIGRSATLCAAHATVCLINGDGGEMVGWAEAAERALADHGHPDADEMIGVAKLIKASAGTDTGLEAAADELAAGRPALPPGSAWSELCCYVEGAMRHLAGDPGRAREVLMEGARLGASVAPSPYAIIRGQLSLLELDEGNVEEAWEHSFKALGVIERFGLEAYPTSALAFAAAALAGCRRGDPEAARERLSLAASLQAKQHDLNQWYEAETRIAMAKSRILLDDVVGARAELAIAARCAARVPDATLLRRWLEEATAAADAAGSDPGRWPLTPAELRLLHHLPTHRSFPEIAEQLFVSPNTVKTQAKSIYRKFGATSRAEAVACARAAGLLSSESKQTDRGGETVGIE